MTAAAMPRKPKPDDPPAASYKEKRKTMPIQVASDLAHIAGVIAAHDGITVGQLVNDYLRPFLVEHYRRVQAEIAVKMKELDAGG